MGLIQTNSLLKDKNLPDTVDSDALVRALFTIANSSNAMRTLKNLSRPIVPRAQRVITTEKGKIKFTEKEIDYMPDSVKKFIIINDKMLTYRIVRGMYQIRYHRDGYSIEVASKDFDTAKRKFLAALNNQTINKPNNTPLVKDFIVEWLKFKKPSIKDSTYNSYVTLINSEIIPNFGEKHIDTITRKEIQDYLHGLIEAEKNRTAQKVKQLLGAIFVIACEDYNFKSPMAKIVLPHYEVKKGTPLTLEEEKYLVDFCIEHINIPDASALLILNYTGMRVGELASMVYYDGEFPYIECETEKIRKGYAKEFRKIPISPMFKKVLPYIDFEKAKTRSRDQIKNFMIKVFNKKHHPHELRYTFITRCKECGCNLELVMLWDGHKFDKDVASSNVDRGYTKYSDSFYFKEIEKVVYEL